jgi:hypothetical protein
MEHNGGQNHFDVFLYGTTYLRMMMTDFFLPSNESDGIKCIAINNSELDLPYSMPVMDHNMTSVRNHRLTMEPQPQDVR